MGFITVAGGAGGSLGCWSRAVMGRGLRCEHGDYFCGGWGVTKLQVGTVTEGMESEWVLGGDYSRKV